MAGSSGGGQGPGGTKKARIEIIPLIDVIFFLLATFVLFTISLNKSGGLPSIALPSTHTSEPRDPGSSATISIRADGTLGWDKEPITLDQFLVRLEAFKKTQPDGKILINGDENALFQQVRYVIDEVRKAGLRKVHIETRIRAAE